jgi:DNA-binding PadR family transcriptional regulator
MFGFRHARHEGPPCRGRDFGGHHAGPRGGRSERGEGPRGWGEDGPGFGRGGGRRRMFDGGELRLVLLKLIADKPRHGYDLIRAIEERTGGAYAPSPGIVYPTLTYLEEAGYVTVQADGAKKLYTITEEGRAHLAGNQDFVDAVLARLSAIGEKATRIREHFARPEYEDEGRGRRRGRGDRGRGDDDRDSVPPLVRAALENLRDIAAGQIEADEDAETKIVEVLARAAQELKKS